MATYYWVGGAGTWTSSSTANWSLSSGGVGGAGPPTSVDNVIFDSGSGASALVTVSGECPFFNLTVPAPGTQVYLGTASYYTDFLACYGSVNTTVNFGFSNFFGDFGAIPVNITFKGSGTGRDLVVGYYSSAPTLDRVNVEGGAGVRFYSYVAINQLAISNGSVTLMSATSTGYGTLTADFGDVLVDGYFTPGSYVFTGSLCDLAFSSIGNPARMAVTVFRCNPSGTTTISGIGTGAIEMNSTGATFYGGGKTYYRVGTRSVGSGALNIYDSNYIQNFTSYSGLSLSRPVIFEAGSITQTDDTLLGTSPGALVIASFYTNVPGSTATIYSPLNAIRAYEASFKDIVATGNTIGAPVGSGNIDNGNNTNIYFGINQGQFLGLF